MAPGSSGSPAKRLARVGGVLAQMHAHAVAPEPAPGDPALLRRYVVDLAVGVSRVLAVHRPVGSGDGDAGWCALDLGQLAGIEAVGPPPFGCRTAAAIGARLDAGWIPRPWNGTEPVPYPPIPRDRTREWSEDPLDVPPILPADETALVLRGRLAGLLALIRMAPAAPSGSIRAHLEAVVTALAGVVDRPGQALLADDRRRIGAAVELLGELLAVLERPAGPRPT